LSLWRPNLVGGDLLLAEYKRTAMLATRLIQLTSIVLVITGFLWASSDMLLITVLKDSPVTPLSVLLMLYGFVGSVISEVLARLISRNNSSSAKKPDGGA